MSINKKQLFPFFFIFLQLFYDSLMHGIGIIFGSDTVVGKLSKNKIFSSTLYTVYVLY